MTWRYVFVRKLKLQNKNEPKKETPDEGLEPSTLRLRVSCSTDWANRARLRGNIEEHDHIPGAADFNFFSSFKWVCASKVPSTYQLMVQKGFMSDQRCGEKPEEKMDTGGRERSERKEPQWGWAGWPLQSTTQNGDKNLNLEWLEGEKIGGKHGDLSSPPHETETKI